MSRPLGDINDVHLIIQYTLDDVLGNLTTIRSNRFYLNRDKADFNIMNDFHSSIETF